MPKLSEVFASSLLKADDLQGKDVTVTIESVEVKAFDSKQSGGKENKHIIHFKGKDKALVCNKTNAKTISKLYGDDTDAWLGKQIIIGPREVEFQGEMTWAIRVSLRKPAASAPATTNPRAVTERQLANQDDDIPGLPDAPF